MCWHKRQMAHTCQSTFGRVGGPALYACVPCKLYHRCTLGGCVQGALCRVTGALRVVIYEGQEAPAGGRSGGRRAAVAAADLAAADVVRAVLVVRALGACMPCAACADNAPCSRVLDMWTITGAPRHASELQCLLRPCYV